MFIDKFSPLGKIKDFHEMLDSKCKKMKGERKGPSQSPAPKTSRIPAKLNVASKSFDCVPSNLREMVE